MFQIFPANRSLFRPTLPRIDQMIFDLICCAARKNLKTVTVVLWLNTSEKNGVTWRSNTSLRLAIPPLASGETRGQTERFRKTRLPLTRPFFIRPKP